MISPIQVRRHPRARQARLSIDPASGTVRLTLPTRARLRRALEWAEDQLGWIEAQRATLPAPRPFAPDAVLPVNDEQLVIAWSPDGPRRIERVCHQLRCGAAADMLSARVERWLRAEALRVLREDCAEIARSAGVTVQSVAVGDPKARWGSCSAAGALRFSWRLILAPGWVRRSTVAHEVAHRVHMNHSSAFHALAAELDEGDPKASRDWLRRNGAALHWYGRSSDPS